MVFGVNLSDYFQSSGWQRKVCGLMVKYGNDAIKVSRKTNQKNHEKTNVTAWIYFFPLLNYACYAYEQAL